MKINLLLVLALILASAGCSRYGYVRLNYPTAPVAYLPEDVNSIAAVNRSLTREEDTDERIRTYQALSELQVQGL